ncbi:MAG TPA: tetratricopeptide repeat protein [Candidatus Dormibacteraeota bacterium]|nr:tetratricopeptide repeat protein [Candidatus Dormibacteraeota bacterium]
MEIRPGTVKQARMDAGLSLGQVARSDISRTAIYFVEVGKAKPSMETLRLIADRTGRPLDYFLAEPTTAPLSEIEIGNLERLVSIGDNIGAAARAEHLLGQRLDAPSEARIKLIAGLAYLRLGQPLTGRRYAAAARAYFERTGDRLMVAEALGTEAQGAQLMHDPIALHLAESAVDALRSLKSYPSSSEARLLAILAQVQLSNQQWREAIDTYEKAIAAGGVVQDMRRLSLMYSGLGMAFEQTGEIAEASRYVQKAIALHETLQDRLSLARSLDNLGSMLVRLNDAGAARKHIERALRIFEEEGVETGRGSILLSLCELELAEGNVERAAEVAEEAAEVASRLHEAPIEAQALLKLGRIAARRGQDEAADGYFAASLGAAESLGRGADLSRIHAAYAEVLEARGALAEANRHLRAALAASSGTVRPAEVKSATA